MTYPGSDLLPSVERLLARAGALEGVGDVDAREMSGLPVFQTAAWKRSIAEFLRWSGTTPDTSSSSSVFRLMLDHGPAGARALFDAYRHDRLERSRNYEEADAELEAVRTIVNMAAHWLHLIDWDLHAAPRLSAEEFQLRRRARGNGFGTGDGPGAERADRRFSEAVEKLLRHGGAGPDGGVRHIGARPAAAPVYPPDLARTALWKRADES